MFGKLLTLSLATITVSTDGFRYLRGPGTNSTDNITSITNATNVTNNTHNITNNKSYITTQNNSKALAIYDSRATCKNPYFGINNDYLKLFRPNILYHLKHNHDNIWNYTNKQLVIKKNNKMY